MTDRSNNVDGAEPVPLRAEPLVCPLPLSDCTERGPHGGHLSTGISWGWAPWRACLCLGLSGRLWKHPLRSSQDWITI